MATGVPISLTSVVVGAPALISASATGTRPIDVARLRPAMSATTSLPSVALAISPASGAPAIAAALLMRAAKALAIDCHASPVATP